jgi:3D (Asp-Asp-Asp) domain-containing protein
MRMGVVNSQIAFFGQKAQKRLTKGAQKCYYLRRSGKYMSIKISRFIEIFFVWGVVGGVIFSLSGALAAVQENISLEPYSESEDSFVLIQNNTVSAVIEHYYSGLDSNEDTEETKEIRVAITAYSSCPLETDSDPFITASGEWVQDGVVAANFLAFGTKIKIPELYGNKVFIVQDRMHPRKKYQVDIWFPSKTEAIDFGAHYSYIELVEET